MEHILQLCENTVNQANRSTADSHRAHTMFILYWTKAASCFCILPNVLSCGGSWQWYKESHNSPETTGSQPQRLSPRSTEQFTDLLHRSTLLYRLIVANPSLRMTNRLWKGHRYVTWSILNFWSPIHIWGIDEATAVILCTACDQLNGSGASK